MKKTKEILAELAVLKNFCIYFFSFKGCFPRSAFWGGFLFAHAVRSTLDFAGYMCSSFKLLPLDSYEVIAWFGYFYVVLSAFEKRCRDLRMQGFWVTLIVTAFHLSLIPRVDKAVPNCFPVFSDIIFYIMLLFSKKHRKRRYKKACACKHRKQMLLSNIFS